VAALARDGELPGRQIGEAWRFARTAVLAWLAHEGSGAAPATASPAPAHGVD
jgi:hypothetical protein